VEEKMHEVMASIYLPQHFRSGMIGLARGTPMGVSRDAHSGGEIHPPWRVGAILKVDPIVKTIFRPQ
jgi:hypothetical protein